MRIKLLASGQNVYSSYAYLVLGPWNRIEDINSLVDSGADGPAAVSAIKKIATGLGKHAVEQVILTHSHSDHIAGLAAIIEKFQPQVYAMAAFEGVTDLLRDGQIIRMGDSEFEVLSAPWHSDDSICLYCPEKGVLFSGDTPLRICSPGGSYHHSFVDFLERLCHRKINVLYSGHDLPMFENVQSMLAETLKNVRRSRISY